MDSETSLRTHSGGFEKDDLSFLEHLTGRHDFFDLNAVPRSVRAACEDILERCGHDTYRPTSADLCALDREMVAMASPEEPASRRARALPAVL
jgi:hypothetical protein